jgi:signal peptidase II
MKFDRERIVPLFLTAGVILVDQVTKAIIAANWPIGTMIADVFGNGFLHIYHVRNKLIAFSLGNSIPDALRPVVFIVLPLLVLAVLLAYYFRSDAFTRIQRWATAGIIGGGIGNLIDRTFRPEGVVDFISVRFYGLFGFERWPTFNIADSCVVVGCILLLATIIFSPKETKKEDAP